MKPRIFVAVPCSTPFVYTKWMMNFLNQMAGYEFFFGNFDPGSAFMEAVSNHPNLPTSRNNLFRHAFDSSGFNATHILFLDSDIIMPERALYKMLDYNVGVCGALCFTKDVKNPEPIMYKGTRVVYPGNERGPEVVDSTGTGCLLVKREVFDSISTLEEFDRNGQRFFVYREEWDGMKSLRLSEDRYFCRLARDAGYQIIVDTSLTCKHLTPHGVGDAEYLESIARNTPNKVF